MILDSLLDQLGPRFRGLWQFNHPTGGLLWSVTFDWRGKHYETWPKPTQAAAFRSALRLLRGLRKK